jgi:hypothetical protein
MLAPSPVAGQAPPTCDEEGVADAKKHFVDLRNARKAAPGSIADETFRAAAQRYIDLAESCYLTTYGAIEERTIDHGGVWASGSGPAAEEFNTFGTKWGAGSPYPAGQDVPGPGLAGGTVTWSLMEDGVAMGSHAPDDNTAITSLPTFSACFLEEIRVGLDAWAAVADIQFQQVVDNGVAFNGAGAAGDIRIGTHAFDGPSGVLAHGFFPPPNGLTAAGDVHLDVAENWQCTPGTGALDLGIVATHEFGHAIGLSHQTAPPTALMNPFYNPVVSGPLADDILGAESIYGSGVSPGSPGTFCLAIANNCNAFKLRVARMKGEVVELLGYEFGCGFPNRELSGSALVGDSTLEIGLTGTYDSTRAAAIHISIDLNTLSGSGSLTFVSDTYINAPADVVVVPCPSDAQVSADPDISR